MVQISQEAIDEVGRVSAAVAAAQEEARAKPTRTFTLTLSLDSEAFGEDQWDREMEVARILRGVADSMYGNAIAASFAALKDRHGSIVGTYEFKGE